MPLTFKFVTCLTPIYSPMHLIYTFDSAKIE